MEGYDRDMEEALELMKCKLPEYLVNCLVAAGYDTISVISKIDDDSLQEIESFIAETSPDDMKHMHSSSTRNCRFPPGYVKKLKMFVSDQCQCLHLLQRRHAPVVMSKAMRIPFRSGKLCKEVRFKMAEKSERCKY